MTRPDPVALRCACRIYRFLLFAYPAGFRRDYSREMTTAFRDRCRDIFFSQRSRGLLSFALQVLADWFKGVIRERLASMPRTRVSRLRFTLLLLVAINLFLAGSRVFLYRPLLNMRGGTVSVLEPIALLMIYAVAISRASMLRNPARQTAIKMGALFGLLTGLLFVVHVALESFGTLQGHSEAIATLAFMLGSFLLWGIAGYSAVRITNRASSGALAGIWSAITSMLITVTFGFALLYTGIPRPEYVATWPEFQRSGWTDVHAFSIANSFEAAFEHLIEGPVIGAIFGGIAGLLAAARSKVAL